MMSLCAGKLMGRNELATFSSCPDVSPSKSGTLLSMPGSTPLPALMGHLTSLWLEEQILYFAATSRLAVLERTANLASLTSVTENLIRCRQELYTTHVK